LNVFVVSNTNSGLPLSFALACNTVFCEIVTVVSAVDVLIGVSPLVTVQFKKVYPLLESGIALISTVFPYLYVHAPFTEEIHVHLFNVSEYVSLSYQHA
jgi:hypothetical protein